VVCIETSKFLQLVFVPCYLFSIVLARVIFPEFEFARIKVAVFA